MTQGQPTTQGAGGRGLQVQAREGHAKTGEPVMEVRNFSFYYGDFRALDDISMTAPRNEITALIGSSGSGKSTLLRAMNRMHDRTPGTRGEGEMLLRGENILEMDDLVKLRKRVGMIFQRPNPFPMTIFDNVAYGLQLQAQRRPRGEIAGLVEQALRAAALWDEVKDKLKQSGLALSGGQQQRLCIARAIAVEPEVLLMDEPCSALDPISTYKVEELMFELERNFTIVIVTHNLQQAARVSDQTVFMTMNPDTRAGFIVEAGPTAELFNKPHDKRTEDYITGRFG